MVKQGKIRNDEVWEGKISIEGDVIIEKDVVVEIKPGTEIKFSKQCKYNSSLKKKYVDSFNKTYTKLKNTSFEKARENKCYIIVRGRFLCKGKEDKKISIGNRQWRGGIILERHQSDEDKKDIIVNSNIQYASLGILAESSSVLEVTESKIENCIYGIVCGGRHSVIRDSNIQNNEIGVLYIGSGTNRLFGNVIMGNKYGVAFNEAESYEMCPVINNNKIVENDVGMHLAYLANLEVYENEISENRVGIYCEEIKQARIFKNKIQRNKDTGIIFSKSAQKIHLFENIFFENGEKGIECQEDSEIVIEKNQVFEKNLGFCLRDQSRCLIQDNKIESEKTLIRIAGVSKTRVIKNKMRGGQGIKALGNSEIEIEKNSIDTIADGVICGEESNAKLFQNELRGDRGTGIGVGGMGLVEAVENRVEGYEVGVGLHEEGHVKLKGNRVKTINGIKLSGNSEIEVYANKIEAEEKVLRCEDATVCKMKGNELKGNSGLNAGGISEIEIKWNKISTVVDGVICEEESRGKVYGNEIKGKKGVGIGAEGMSLVEAGKNRVEGYEAGIEVRDEGQIVLNKNRIKDCIIGVFYENNKIKVKRRNIFKNVKNRFLSPNIERPVAVKSDENFLYQTKFEFLKNRLQNFVSKSSHIFLFYYAYKLIYKIALFLIINSFKKIEEIKSIYLRRGMTLTDWLPGGSDLDLLATIEELDLKDEIKLMRKIWKSYAFFKKIFPFLGEFHISTKNELRNYLRFGGIRAWEAKKQWKLLYGNSMDKVNYVFNEKKFKIDTGTEILNSYRIINDLFINKSNYINKDYHFIKSFIDILKYSIYLKNPEKVFNNRADVISCFISYFNQDNDLLKKIYRIWIKRRSLTDDSRAGIYLFAINLLNKVLKEINVEVTQNSAVSNLRKEFKIIDSINFKDQDYAGLSKWKDFCSEIYDITDNIIKFMILDTPGLFYVVIEEEKLDNDSLRNLSRVLNEKKKIYFKETPILLLTKDMFQGLLISLHMETPFNYFKITDEFETGIVFTDFEKRYQSDIKLNDFSLPDSQTIELLIKETVSLISISLRMYNSEINPLNRLIYLYKRIIGLSLALEKRIIAPFYLSELIKVYREHFPEYGDYMNYAEEKSFRYINSGYKKMLVANHALLDHYPFFRNVLDRLYKKVF